MALDKQTMVAVQRGVARFDAWFSGDGYTANEYHQIADLILQVGDGRLRGWNSKPPRIRYAALGFLSYETTVSLETLATLWAHDKTQWIRETLFTLWGATRTWHGCERAACLWERLAPTMRVCDYCAVMQDSCFCGSGCKHDLGAGAAPVWPYGCKVNLHA